VAIVYRDMLAQSTVLPEEDDRDAMMSLRGDSIFKHSVEDAERRMCKGEQLCRQVVAIQKHDHQ